MNIAIFTIGLVFLLNSTFAIEETSGIKIYKNCHEDSTGCSDGLDLERSARSNARNFLEWLPTMLNVIVFAGPELLKMFALALITSPCFEPFKTIFNFIGGPECIFDILRPFFEGLVKFIDVIMPGSF